MKLTFLPTVISLLLLVACSEKKVTTVAETSPYLTPEIMCGTVEFKDGCGPRTDSLIRFGLALIHHMTYDDAAYTFDKVIETDPDCFWGHWGKAMTYIHPLWPDVPSAEQMENGYVLAQRALGLAKNPNEKLYGAALAAYYEKGDKNKPARLAAFEQGWKQTHEQLPDDPEAELFYNLFRLSTVSPGDKTFAVQKEVGAATEALLEKYPNHPGAFHYSIHAYDVPPLAPKALTAARNYGKIAPEIPHALHMPSHIFTRLGLWQESIDWNSRSAKAALRMPINGQVSSHAFHALDYMTYAHLQFGEDEKALAIIQGLDTLSDKPYFSNPATAYAVAAMPARIPLENHHWEKAALLPDPDTSKIQWKKYPQYEALTYFAKGIGGARSKNLDVARASASQLERIYTELGDAVENKYWKDQVNIQRLAVNAWIAYAEGDKAKGLQLMNESADLEEATQKNPVSPGELLPARELLGDMLMELNMPGEALAAYQKSLESRPNRFNSIYGAGKAAEVAGQQETAKSFYAQLISLKGQTPSTRDRVAYAQKRAAGS
jgi:tetratricopeptide (TPR) repeat protein